MVVVVVVGFAIELVDFVLGCYLEELIHLVLEVPVYWMIVVSIEHRQRKEEQFEVIRLLPIQRERHMCQDQRRLRARRHRRQYSAPQNLPSFSSYSTRLNRSGNEFGRSKNVLRIGGDRFVYR